jgi:hypothetical protein
MGFQDSFVESFEKVLPTATASSSSASLELMKEKIKKDTLKAEQQTSITSNLSLVAEMAKTMDPASQEQLAPLLNIKHTPESAKSVADFATKLATMEQKIKTQASLPAVIFDPSKGTYTDTEGNPVSKTSPGQTVRSLFVSPELEADKARARKEVELEMEPAIASEVQRAKEEVSLDYPTMDEKGKAAVSAYKFIEPRIESFKKIVDSGLFKDKGLWKQVLINKDGSLLVPDGSPLEEAVGLINAVKLTGFNIAGTAFTGSEKEVAFTLLNPVGKSDKQIKTDVDSFLGLFESRIESATEGLRGAKKLTEEIKSKREGGSEKQTQGKTESKIPSRGDAPTGAKGWSKSKQDWVF